MLNILCLQSRGGTPNPAGVPNVSPYLAWSLDYRMLIGPSTLVYSTRPSLTKRRKLFDVFSPRIGSVWRREMEILSL